ncbi:MAG: hypothetical protein QFB87_04730 [Patescibacteria group bacterium]|nr:hypothetical protein [Patescibacteria group bacterium]
MKTATVKARTFEQMGSLEVMWKLIVRHQAFLLCTAAVLEGIYILVAGITG